ncbi:hypothetical protein RSAG8_05707, partial [Rhizoctonia solani AG-8 WAC10335]
MPAVNKAFACLVFRFTVSAVSDPDKPWDFFPFNNERFCHTAGIRSTDVGFSEPPTGALGATLSADDRQEWPTQAERALDWLTRCDAHIASLGEKKPKGWEGLQKNVLNVVEGRESWEWLVSRCFGASNGLYDRLKELMRDHRCDGYIAYQRARADQNQFREWQVTDITKFDNYWPSAQESLTRALCGDALGTGSPPVSWYPTIRALVARIFEPTARSISNRVRALRSQEEELEGALEAVNADPTKEALRKVTTVYGKLLAKQRSLGITGQAEEIGLWRVKLDALMKSLGREKQDGQSESAENSRALLLANLPLELNAFPQDIGVEKWRALSTEEIEKALGIPETGLPGSALGPDGKPALKLSWSQWVAILEMANRSFTHDGEVGTPALLADEIMQDSNPAWPNTDGSEVAMKWPPVFGKSFRDSIHLRYAWVDMHVLVLTYPIRNAQGGRKSFMGRGKIPALPSIVVVPPTLMAQWNAELRAWLSPTACHILEYRGNSSERERFFSEGREYDLAMGHKHKERTIIMAEAPSVINESKNVLFIQGDCAMATPNTGPPQLVANSIYGREYLLGVLEESHAYRSWGDNFRAMLSLMNKCLQRVSVTATPLYGHPRNLLFQGRLLGAANFIGPNGVALTKKVEGQFKLHQKAWNNDPEEQQSLRRFLTSLHSTTDAEGAAEADAHSALIDHLLSQKGQSLDSYRPFWSAREGLFTLRDELWSVVIRRDKRSVDNKGQNLLPYVAKVDSLSYFTLDAATDAAIASKTATKKARSDCRVDIGGWLTDIKKALIHPILIVERDDTRTFKEWVGFKFPTRAAYEANPSAKLDRLLLCIKHHIGDKNKDAGPLFWNRNGTLKEESGPQTAGVFVPRDASKRRKVVIFCNVSESWILASHILKLHGYETLHVNGMMTRAARDESVQAFQSEDEPDILFISEGHDHPWSASEAQQIIGQVERRGQDDDVYVYRLTCENSLDELVQEYASGKRLMFQVYTGECAIRGITAGTDNDPESEDEGQARPANSHSQSPASRSKGKGKGKAFEEYGSSPNIRGSAGKRRKQFSDSPEEIVPSRQSSGDSDEENESDLTSDQIGVVGLLTDGRISLDQAQSILRESGQRPIPLSHIPSQTMRRLPSKLRRHSTDVKGPSRARPSDSQATLTPSHHASGTASQHTPHKAPRPIDPSSSETSSESSSEGDD